MVFVTIDILCPEFTVLTSVDPPLVVFCLDYEYPEHGNDDVIDLRAVATGLKEKIVDDQIVFLREEGQQGGNLLFTSFALRPAPNDGGGE